MKKILAVDDDPDILDILVEVLSESGYQVDGVGSVEEGEKILQQQLPHLVLLDLHLPGKTGRYLAQKIKSTAETSHIPVVLFSSHHELEMAAESVKADSFLEKPFDLDELVSTITSLAPCT
jgi:DNA-binding response OmpR family regulator